MIERQAVELSAVRADCEAELAEQRKVLVAGLDQLGASLAALKVGLEAVAGQLGPEHAKSRARLRLVTEAGEQR